MKIIRQGTLPQNVVYTGTCLHCGCQVEAAYTEVTRRNLGDRYSGEFIECSLLCPTKDCGRKILMVEKPTPKPPPTPKSEMDRVFEELFEDPKPNTPPEIASVVEGILDKVIAKHGRLERGRITEGIAKKGQANCGIHRVSELARRFKKLPGIREKTLTEYADEL